MWESLMMTLKIFTKVVNVIIWKTQLNFENSIINTVHVFPHTVLVAAHISSYLVFNHKNIMGVIPTSLSQSELFSFFFPLENRCGRITIIFVALTTHVVCVCDQPFTISIALIFSIWTCCYLLIPWFLSMSIGLYKCICTIYYIMYNKPWIICMHSCLKCTQTTIRFHVIIL